MTVGTTYYPSPSPAIPLTGIGAGAPVRCDLCKDRHPAPADLYALPMKAGATAAILNELIFCPLCEKETPHFIYRADLIQFVLHQNGIAGRLRYGKPWLLIVEPGTSLVCLSGLCKPQAGERPGHYLLTF